MYCTPGALNSILINTENAVPTSPANKANIRYKVPISLAFDDQNHLSRNIDTVLGFWFKLDIFKTGETSTKKPYEVICFYTYSNELVLA